MHERKRIRNNAAALLRDKTPAGVKVEAGRADAIWETHLPVISVYTRSEAGELRGEGPRDMKNLLELSIEAHVTGDTEAECLNTLDDMSELIENILAKDYTIGGVAEDLLLVSTQMNVQDDGNKLVGALTLLYDVVYIRAVVQTSDSDLINALTLIHADWQVGHHGESPDDTVVDAETEVILPQE